MSDRLPSFVDPFMMADKNAHLEGKIALSSLDRLSELLVDDAGDVIVRMDFGKEGKQSKVEGHISAVLPLKCQRCLEVLEWAVAYDFKLGIVSSFAQADGLPEGFEPLMLPEDGKVSVKDIVEDEILIILPDIPKHAADCVVAPSPGNNKPINTKQLQQVVTHPFSILADFKKLETLNGSTKK